MAIVCLARLVEGAKDGVGVDCGMGGRCRKVSGRACECLHVQTDVAREWSSTADDLAWSTAAFA